MERTIRVTGKGKLTLAPDWIELTIRLNGMYDEYSDALEASAVHAHQLRELLIQQGFEGKALKTCSLDINARYESFQKHLTMEWVRELTGYEYRHTLSLGFPKDNKLLGKTLYTLAHSELNPELSVQYTVFDKEAAKNDLLANAVADARGKAGVLAAAGGVQLGDVQLIDYSWGTIDFISPMCMDYGNTIDGMPTERAIDIDIEPEDIQVSDTVTVVWNIR